jgi:hypothetical protein
VDGESNTCQQSPRIDAVTGDLFFCLDEDTSGMVKFNVSLIDSGSTLHGGRNRYGPATMKVIVLPVNQAPSFRACENSLNLGCERHGLCCPNKIRIWNGGQKLEYPNFVHDILRGNRNSRTGEDNEFTQNVTFVFDSFYITSEIFHPLYGHIDE